MKKGAVLLALVLCLTGCGGKNPQLQRGLALRSRVLKASQCSFTAEITADYGDKVYSFTMDCAGDPEGNLTFEVTAPEAISGITGTLTGEKGQLTFEDTALHFDLLAEGWLSPVSAPWIFYKTLRSGCITSAGMDGELLRLSIDDGYADDALHLDIWCGEGDLPVKAEIRQEQRNILSLSVKNFTLE